MASPRPDTRLEVSVPEALDGERIDRVVAMLADLSRRESVDLIGGGRVTVNNVAPAKTSERLVAGATIVIMVPERDDTLAPAPNIVVPVVYEDEHLLVVDKPAELVVHPGSGVTEGTMIQALLARYPDIAEAGGESERPGIVHRLDRGTSGLLMVARTNDARLALSSQLADRSVLRRYLALVWGTVESTEGLIDAPLGRSPRDATRRAVIVGGRPARTRYRVLGRGVEPAVTLLACRLETGRTHQIRAHLEAIDHPVVADQRYAPGQPTLGLQRLFLHAANLGFTHPVSGNEMRFTSPMPRELVQVGTSLGLGDELLNTDLLATDPPAGDRLTSDRRTSDRLTNDHDE